MKQHATVVLLLHLFLQIMYEPERPSQIDSFEKSDDPSSFLKTNLAEFQKVGTKSEFYWKLLCLEFLNACKKMVD